MFVRTTLLPATLLLLVLSACELRPNGFVVGPDTDTSHPADEAATHENVVHFITSYVFRWSSEAGEDVLQRWESPARVEIRGEYAHGHEDALDQSLATLRAVGLPGMTRVASGGNLIVNVLSPEDFFERFPSASSNTVGRASARGRLGARWVLEGGEAWIRTDMSLAAFKRVLLHELGHTIGISHPNSFSNVPMIMHQGGSARTFHLIETAVLRAIYSSGRLRAGMTAAEVDEALR